MWGVAAYFKYHSEGYKAVGDEEASGSGSMLQWGPKSSAVSCVLLQASDMLGQAYGSMGKGSARFAAAHHSFLHL